MSLTFHPRVWLNAVAPALTPLEKRILKFTTTFEIASYRSLVSAQIEAINFVQRHCDGRELYFYCIKHGISRKSLGTQFLLPNKEWLWAKVNVVSSATGTCIVELRFLNGRLGSMTANSSMRRFDEKNCDLKMLQLNSISATKIEMFSSVAKVPKDLEKFVAQAANAASSIVFIPPKATYEIVLPEGKFVVIGEVVDVGALLVGSNDNEAFLGLYLGAYDGSTVKFLGNDCAEATEFIKSTLLQKDS